jgi:hypothetical protein
MAMKKSIGDIYLSDGPIVNYGNRDYCSKCGKFDYWGERLLIVNARLLGIVLRHQPRLISVDGAIRVPFDPKNPLISNHIFVSRLWNKGP